ncbi:MAG TPA: hypothetical protein VKA02_05585 [Candidatus Acidoferrum sp.]|nr:hypothetical protein [Candidatus Acidoferrum sp.]
MSWGILPTPTMKRSRDIPIAPGKMGAWVCLVAVALLWTPLWATTWQDKGMACCDGKMCAARGHAMAQHSSGNASVTQESAPMDCGHGNQAGMHACDMKCCQEQGSTIIAAVIFVLPEPVKISAPAEASRAREQVQAVMTPHLFEPPSPPPRSIVPNA